MHCCLWFRSVFRVRGPWPKRYGYHLSIIYIFFYFDRSLSYYIVLTYFSKLLRLRFLTQYILLTYFSKLLRMRFFNTLHFAYILIFLSSRG